ncbi:hypothetical protein O0L34_g12695 [Tuta absoluta]|nr:hypothetical protein O0L34_g12695 [Tuta absoluta]
MVRADLATYVSEHRNSDRLKETVINNALDIFPGPQTESKIEQYLAMQFENGFWGGEDIIIATTERYLVNVHVYINDNYSKPVIYKPSRFSVPADIHIHYLTVEVGCEHYSSLIINTNLSPVIDRPRPEVTPLFTETAVVIDNTTLAYHSNLDAPPREHDMVLSNSPLPNSHNNINAAADSTGRRLLRTSPPPPVIIQVDRPCNDLNVATWNVRGCAQLRDRHSIDLELTSRNITLAALQETHMSTGDYASANYTWILGGGVHAREKRGIAILIDKKVQHEVIKIYRKGCNVIAILVRIYINIENIPIPIDFFVISTHVPANSSTCFNQIGTLIRQAPKQAFIILLGDFNAHIGCLEIRQVQHLVGTNLYHQHSNYNGSILISFLQKHNMKASSTWGRSSCKKTWSGAGNKSSQIDYIITSLSKPIFFDIIKGDTSQLVNTDHKLVFGRIRLGTFQNSPRTNDTRHSSIRKATFDHRKYDYVPLQKEEVQLKFQQIVKEKLQLARLALLESNTQSDTLSWDTLNSILKVTAQVLLSKPIAKSRESRLALAQLQKLLFLKNREPHNQSLNRQVKSARTYLKKIQEEEDAEECEIFFKKLSEKHRAERMKITYRYLRKHKAKIARTQSRFFIPMSQWVDDLKKSEGSHVQLLEEANATVLEEDAPETDDIASIVRRMKNGTVPGTDQVVPELYKAAPWEFLEEMTKVMKEAWLNNSIPEEWQLTKQVPIPKKNPPRQISDFRKISICNVGYRIYANFLLEKLDSKMDALGNYQAAFLDDRSTDDHIFTLRRIGH